MQHALQVFEYEDHSEFRTVEIDGESWFFGDDVCDALDIKNPSEAYARLDEDDLAETECVDERGQKQTFKVVSDSGLYSLILRSDKPEAERFKRWVTHEVLPQVRCTGGHVSGRDFLAPKFIRRFNANWDRVDNGYFSVVSELAIRLWGRLEQVGHIMADKAPDGAELRPDVRVGKRFAAYLDVYYPELANDFTYYLHWTEAGEFPARQYPMKLLPAYIEFIDGVWIPQYSEDYFRTRDPAALPHLPKLLPSSMKPKPGMVKRPTVRWASR